MLYTQHFFTIKKQCTMLIDDAPIFFASSTGLELEPTAGTTTTSGYSRVVSVPYYPNRNVNQLNVDIIKPPFVAINDSLIIYLVRLAITHT